MCTHLFFFLKDLLVYPKAKLTEWEGETEREKYLPFASSLPRCLQQLEYSHVKSLNQILRPPPAALPGTLVERWLGNRTARTPAGTLMWDASILWLLNLLCYHASPCVWCSLFLFSLLFFIMAEFSAS